MKDLNEAIEAAEKAGACSAQFTPFKKAVESGKDRLAYQIAFGNRGWLLHVGVLSSGDIPTLEKLAEGVAVRYHESGQILNRETYKNNKRHGLCEWWHGNGQLRVRAVYEGGIKVK